MMLGRAGAQSRWIGTVAVLAMLSVAATSSRVAAKEAPRAARTPAYDLVIRGGTVFDGSGAPGVLADVGIRGDRIVHVGDLGDAPAREVLDARGRYVVPGFISVHDHTEPGMHAKPVGLLTQGITTAIMNPDGFGPVKIFAALDGQPAPGINYGAYSPFNGVWAEVVGQDNRRPTDAEIATMRGLVRAGLEDGAFGVAAGLDYKPGFWAQTDEIVRIVDVARPWRTAFPNHERLASFRGDSSLVGMAETIAIGERSGLTPVITHMKMLALDVGRVEEAFTMFGDAAARGVPVGIDSYPYTFAATDLDQILVPPWAQEGGREALLKRIADPSLEPRIAADTDRIIESRIRGAGNVYLPDLGRELVDIATERGISPGRAVLRLLAEGQTRVMLRSGIEADLQRILRDPLTAISCDCGAISITTGHPRNWGNYPLFLGRYVREAKLVDWPEAIRKMTALPAAMLGLVDRGGIRPGMYADVTVFDPATIIDRATIREPTLPSIGIEAVIVNGRFAWRGGQFVAGAGRLLRRSGHEPTRPMQGRRAHVLKGSARFAGRTRVRIDVSAGPEAGARPLGRVRIDGLPHGEFFEFDELGSMEAYRGWAAVTGIGHGRNGIPVAATLFIETADPLQGSRPGLALQVEGKTVASGLMTGGRLAVDEVLASAAR